MIKFEKISFEQFQKDMGEDIDELELMTVYQDIKLPQRATANSAGYDIYSPFSFELQPNTTIKIPTGLRAFMEDWNMLKIYIRSSIGFKYDVVLSNSTGIIDADYVDAKNEGHIWVKLINHGTKVLEINKGDAFAQGIFEDFDITDDDCPVSDVRVGGIGSTSNK
jgi:dUTP pyrophosphatase